MPDGLRETFINCDAYCYKWLRKPIIAMSMTLEEQAAEAAKTEAEAKAKAEEDARAKETETERAAREQAEREATTKKHYEDELAKEREAREKAEKAAADAAYKNRHQDEGEDDEEKPLTRAELQSVLERERQLNRVETHRGRIEERIRILASTTEEANLMVEVSKNRAFPSHYSPEDIAEEVYAIANRKKMRLERDEALRALVAKDNANRGGTGGHHDSPRAGEPQVAEADKAEYTRIGFSWNGSTRRYEKRLSDGRLLYKDPQTKKVVLVRKSS